jgi:asparagine N-glycosylation enzyme membrane subunit Stt3
MKKNTFEDAKKIISDPKFQWALTAIIFIIIIFASSSIRLSNLDRLTDSTTGETIPLALDPFYFLRVTQTMAAEGPMPEYDGLRFSAGDTTPWSNEILPVVNLGIYKTFSPIFPASLEFYNVISPVYFYILGIMVFFWLVFIISRKKSLALLASIFLSLNPAYLYRTMAGFSDHESIGMLAFFLSLAVFSLSINYLTKEKKTKLYLASLYGLGIGLATALTIGSWGGVASSLFIIIPLSLFLIYLFNTRKKNMELVTRLLIFYSLWIISTPLFSALIGMGARRAIPYFTGSTGIVSLAVFGFIIVDTILTVLNPKAVVKKFRILYSMAIAGIAGILALPLIGKNPLTLAVSIINELISPFKDQSGRIGSTVAENAQPFLNDWISQMTPTIFWLFFLGLVLFGIVLAKKIKNTKHSIYFGASYLFMISGIIFSKYSSVSTFNGDNFISQAFYLVALGTFWIYFFYLFVNKEFSWAPQDALLFSLIFFTIVSGRAAARVFFLITPFVCLFAAYFLVELFELIKNNKDSAIRVGLGAILVLAAIPAVMGTYNMYSSLEASAQNTAPSAHPQWQSAMGWVRDNTPTDAVFSHWWDYGYWVQSLGQRATVADGGHFQNAFGGDHKNGRYVLTTPNPDTAYSYFKSMKTTHLLIDPTDLGKYGAYSKIGGDLSNDRFSSIPVGLSIPSQIQETSEETIIPYSLNGFVDQDITYDLNGEQIFLPGPTFDKYGNPSAKAYVIGLIVKRTGSAMVQPEVVFAYNNKRYNIPLRYIYFGDNLMDFGSGLDAVVSLIPSLIQGQAGLSIDQMGSAIYLSPKVKDSLFAQVYLLGDAFDNYEYLDLVHEEDSQVVASIKAQAGLSSEFIYYNGFHGPIKIWETGHPAGTIESEEFYSLSHSETDWGVLDYLFE